MPDCCTPNRSKFHPDLPDKFMDSPKGWLTSLLEEYNALLSENAKLKRKVKRLEKKVAHV